MCATRPVTALSGARPAVGELHGRDLPVGAVAQEQTQQRGWPPAAGRVEEEVLAHAQRRVHVPLRGVVAQARAYRGDLQDEPDVGVGLAPQDVGSAVLAVGHAEHHEHVGRHGGAYGLAVAVAADVVDEQVAVHGDAVAQVPEVAADGVAGIAERTFLGADVRHRLVVGAGQAVLVVGEDGVERRAGRRRVGEGEFGHGSLRGCRPGPSRNVPQRRRRAQAGGGVLWRMCGPWIGASATVTTCWAPAVAAVNGRCLGSA